MSTSGGAPLDQSGAPDRQLAGMAYAEVAEPEPTAARRAALADRRAAVGELGDALRELTTSAIGTEVAVDLMREVAEHVRTLAAELGEHQRPADAASSVDDLRRGQRPYNPVVGAGNPIAPPMRVEIADGAAIGWCTLDRRYEGPFTYAHGGISALLLDQIMGYATAAAGHPGVTARLEVRYRATVPLGQPLRLHAQVVDVLGVRSAVTGSISLAAAPDDALVVADGRFLELRPEQADRLFGAAPDQRSP